MLASLLACIAFISPDDNYTITAIEKIVQPYDLKAMNDEFQSAELLNEKDGVGTLRVTFRPLHKQTYTPNPNWQRDDAGMTEYLKPRPAANWDRDLQAEILAELAKVGINPSKLDDATCAQKVAEWAMNRSSFNDQFGLWMIEFRNGKPQIPAVLQGAFEQNEPKGASESSDFDRELFGKAMFENKTHGACTSSSIYLSTVLRAVGIPTRTILTVPAADPNDPSQVHTLLKAIRHDITRHKVKLGVAPSDFTNHVFNEVWIGGKWVRLNYNRLAQPIVDSDYEGLMMHVYTAVDVSDVPFAKTWGTRYGINGGPKLSSKNALQLVSAKDEVADLTTFENPPYPELSYRTIVAVYLAGDTHLTGKLQPGDTTAAWISIKEWLPGLDYHQVNDFLHDAGWHFILHALGHPDVPAMLSGATTNDSHGAYIYLGLNLEGTLEPGVSYGLVPQNKGQNNEWRVANGVSVSRT